jgi:hypothetical protein
MAICSWFMDALDADTGAVQRMIMSDKAHPHLSRYVNKTVETEVMNSCLENIQFVSHGLVCNVSSWNYWAVIL